MKKFLIFVLILAILFAAFVYLYPKLAGDSDSDVNNDSDTTVSDQQDTDNEKNNDNKTEDVNKEDEDSKTETDDAASDDKEFANPETTDKQLPEDGNVETDLGNGSGSSYSLNADPNTYTYASGDGFDRYYLKAAESSDVFMEVRYLPATEAKDAAPSFMDKYIDFTDVEFSGENAIGDTTLLAETITAKNGDISLTAYLFDTDTGVIAVTISYKSQNQAEAFYPLIESLVIG